MVTRGSEPVLLGFKRQCVFEDTGSAVVLNVANAPGLPPVVAVMLVSGDGDASTVTVPDGYELVEVRTCGCMNMFA